MMPLTTIKDWPQGAGDVIELLHVTFEQHFGGQVVGPGHDADNEAKGSSAMHFATSSRQPRPLGSYWLGERVTANVRRIGLRGLNGETRFYGRGIRGTA